VRRLLAISIIGIVALQSGCSASETVFEPDVFFDEDMCVRRTETGRQVCYGQSRLEAEAVAGDGRETMPGTYEYEGGLSLFYRDDKVAAIRLTGDSQDYESIRGLQLGASKEEILELYGSTHLIDSSTRFVDYYYDSQKQEFVGIEATATNSEEAIEIYVISIGLEDDVSWSFMVTDMRHAKYRQ
jgi:hypothetical protein